MKNEKHFLIETDILLEHLQHNDENTLSDLEIAMINGICFTTVINSAELYFAAVNKQEKEAVDNLMKALKVLGINARYSLNISEFFNKVATVRDALFCTIAKINDMIIFTNNIDRYKEVNLKIIQPKNLRGST